MAGRPFACRNIYQSTLRWYSQTEARNLSRKSPGGAQPQPVNPKCRNTDIREQIAVWFAATGQEVMLMRAVTDYYQDIIFMKIGRHADETLDSILARKREEFRRTGRTFWGYGGSTCHPLTQVRPFVRTITEQGGRVNLLMEQMNS